MKEIKNYQKFSYDFWFYGIMKFKKFGNNLEIVSLIIVIKLNVHQTLIDSQEDCSQVY